jgi:hypothetical protein
MKWTVKLVAEVVDNKQIEHEIATIERADGIAPATVGLTIAEGKGILESCRRKSSRRRFNSMMPAFPK